MSTQSSYHKAYLTNEFIKYGIENVKVKHHSYKAIEEVKGKSIAAKTPS